MRERKPADENGVEYDTSWSGALSYYLDSGGKKRFQTGDLVFDDNRATHQKRVVTFFDFEKRFAFHVTALLHTALSGYYHTTMLNHCDGNIWNEHGEDRVEEHSAWNKTAREVDYRYQQHSLNHQRRLSNWLVIPIMEFDITPERNLKFLNERFDYMLPKVAAKQKNTSRASKWLARLEAQVTTFIDYHEMNVIPETLEERVTRLGLQKKFAGYIGRRIVGK